MRIQPIFVRTQSSDMFKQIDVIFDNSMEHITDGWQEDANGDDSARIYVKANGPYEALCITSACNNQVLGYLKDPHNQFLCWVLRRGRK